VLQPTSLRTLTNARVAFGFRRTTRTSLEILDRALGVAGFEFSTQSLPRGAPVGNEGQRAVATFICRVR
jgi:hypothetical protein